MPDATAARDPDARSRPMALPGAEPTWESMTPGRTKTDSRLPGRPRRVVPHMGDPSILDCNVRHHSASGADDGGVADDEVVHVGSRGPSKRERRERTRSLGGERRRPALSEARDPRQSPILGWVTRSESTSSTPEAP